MRGKKKKKMVPCFIFRDAKDEGNYSGGDAAKQTSYEITILGTHKMLWSPAAPVDITFIIHL